MLLCSPLAHSHSTDKYVYIPGTVLGVREAVVASDAAPALKRLTSIGEDTHETFLRKWLLQKMWDAVYCGVYIKWVSNNRFILGMVVSEGIYRILEN